MNCDAVGWRCHRSVYHKSDRYSGNQQILVENRSILGKTILETNQLETVELSCKTEYALLALLELVGEYNGGEPLQIRQIAAHQNIPDRYLEQLLATLRRGGLVRSQRGAKGGYILSREPWKITLFDIIICLEGSESKVSKIDTSTQTVESAVVHDIWQEIHDRVNDTLREYTLQDLYDKRNHKRELNIMYYI